MTTCGDQRAAGSSVFSYPSVSPSSRKRTFEVFLRRPDLWSWSPRDARLVKSVAISEARYTEATLKCTQNQFFSHMDVSVIDSYWQWQQKPSQNSEKAANLYIGSGVIYACKMWCVRADGGCQRETLVGGGREEKKNMDGWVDGSLALLGGGTNSWEVSTQHVPTVPPASY